MGEEEGSLGDEDSTVNRFCMNETSFNFESVRFSPKVIEFIDVFEGKQSSVKITIQNVGTKPVRIKMGKPKSFIFQIKKELRRVRLLAAGASISRTITYSYHNDDMVERSKIPIEINGHLVEYPIIVKKATPEIEVEPTKLDFEIINLGALSKTMELTIHNTGGKRTKFTIDVGKNNLKLVVKPIRGTVSAKSKVSVFIEVMGLKEGEYYSEIWITSNEMPIRVPVLVEVLRPRLEIIHPNETEDFTLIDFPPTFMGTQTVDSFLLKNHSSKPTFFVTLAEVNGNYQFLKDAKKAEETFGMFLVTAEEGCLEAFESRIVTVLFKPKAIVKTKGWSHLENEMKKKNQREHIVFCRIKRIHSEERSDLDQLKVISAQNMVEDKGELVLHFVDPQKSSANPSADGFEDLDSTKVPEACLPESSMKPIRICLHGEAVEPDITIQPSSLEFDRLQVGESKQKVIAVTNVNKIAVKYKFCKTLNVNVTPKEGWLQPKQALECLVVLTPTCSGEFKTKVTFEIFAKSHVVFEKDKSLMKIGGFAIAVLYKADLVQKLPPPKIGLGITPVVTDEVGLLKERMTFKCDFAKPYAAMLLSLTKKFKPEWMRKEMDKQMNLSNAIIAFPNDRPREFHRWPKEKICRTIFQGLFRYSPPADTEYTFTGKEMNDRKGQKAIWTGYLELLRQSRRINQVPPVIDELLLDYERFCEPDFKIMPVMYKSELQKTFFKSQQCESWREFSPLSSMHLGQIKVKPRIINFCAVANDTVTYETVTVINRNTFWISIRFVPGKPELGVLPSGNIRVPPGATKFVKVSFQRKDLGSFFGCLSYAINGSHKFKITIFALVTSKTLHVNEKDLTLEFESYLQKNAFYVRSKFLTLWNFLQFPVRYRWNIPWDSSFCTDPVEGEVPPRAKILTELIFRADPKREFSSELKIISESDSTDVVKVSHANKNITVHFTTHRIDLKEIPLNLPTKVKPIIRNACYQDITFEVMDWTPMPGVSVAPRQGVIKARSFFPLDVRIKIPIIMKFSFEIAVVIHKQQRTYVKIHGKVTAPLIRIRPTDIVMPRICAESFDAVTVCIENAGKTPAEITIDFKDCPGFKVAQDHTKIYLAENKSSKVVVYFHPNDVARYVFYLPIVINNILGPPLMQERQTEYLSYYISKQEELYRYYGRVFQSKSSNFKIPCVTINSSVSPALLKVSSLDIVFRLRTDSCLEFQPHEIEFSNEFVEDVTFCIRTDDLGKDSESPFSLTPKPGSVVEYNTKSIKANLKQNEKLVFKAKFEPNQPGVYNVNVPIYIRGYNNGAVFNFIKLKGELKKSRLYPEYLEVHIPPVPLDVACEATLSVYAENYRYPSFIYCLMYDLNEGRELGTDFLSTSWLNEPNINDDTKTQVFKLQIRFRSLIPIALRSYLVLLDSKGEYCTILVTATSDNSVITTHAFPTTRSTHCKFLRCHFLPPTSNVEEKITMIRGLEGSIVAKDQLKEMKRRKSTQSLRMESGNSDARLISNGHLLPTDQKLCQQISVSASKLNQVNFLDGAKPSVCKSKESSSSVLLPSKIKIIQSVSFQTESSFGTKTLSGPQRSDTLNEVTYPNFPTQDTMYAKHFQETLAYVERWVFEVVMRCDQYFSIPRSFQNLEISKNCSEKSSAKNKEQPKNKAKDFVDFLEEFFDTQIKTLLERRTSKNMISPIEKAKFLQSFYSDVLEFLRKQGCLLPHVKPEYLLDYDTYLLFKEYQNWDTFKWKESELETSASVKMLKESRLNYKSEKDLKARNNSSIFAPLYSGKKSFFSESHFESVSDVTAEENSKQENVSVPILEEQALVEGREFVHETKVLDATSFEVRSTQSWLDVLIQIFKSFSLDRVFLENTIPQAKRVRMTEPMNVDSVLMNCVPDLKKKCVHILQKCSCTYLPVLETLESNLLSDKERALLKWLNFHLSSQEQVLRGYETREPFDKKQSTRVVNNFDRDLMDSIALIAVTMAHCPYIAHEFSDVFLVADTQNKVCHNAAKLILVWRSLGLPLTVETVDIVKPNPLFMMMLVSHLYDVLPSLHPRSIICFSTPLTTEVTRTIQIRNESSHPVFYQANFFGETKGIFELAEYNTIEVKPNKMKKVKITFVARKIQKVSATLVLCGSVVSPKFTKNLAFSLEGVPASPFESKEFTFAVPLYQVVCKDIFLVPPYAEPTTYEVWYTTKEPCYREDVEDSIIAKPWSQIRNKKVSRRLFLNKCNVIFDEKEKVMSLSMTMACLTVKDRSFWLIFRSPQVGDFLVRVFIKPKFNSQNLSIRGFFSESWSPSAVCLCPDGGKNSKVFASNWNKCPFLVELSIPARNEPLWECLRAMFLKTLNTDEKSFWAKHFETNTGFCLILWLLDSDEEEEDVLDEFLHNFQTQVSYILTIEPPDDQHVTIPERINILDVRENAEIRLPVHISKNAPPNLTAVLTMTSESGKEVRRLNLSLEPQDREQKWTKEIGEKTAFSRSVCRPLKMETEKELCKGNKKESPTAK